MLSNIYLFVEFTSIMFNDGYQLRWLEFMLDSEAGLWNKAWIMGSPLRPEEQARIQARMGTSIE